MKSLLSLLFTAVAVAEPVRVHVEPDVVRHIGGITAFDREQYITIHESPDSNDLSEADHRYILDELDAHYGRDGGFLSYQAGTVKADPNDPDMPDLADLKRRAKRFRNSLGTRSEQEAAEMRGTILCTHPELMHAMPKNKHAAWGPRTYEGVAEFTAQFLKHYFTDEDRPRTLEVFNEPFVKARKMGVTIEALAKQHNPVAKRVKELNPDVMVGGYSAAWVEVEARNFAHWNNWQRTFMDIAGENMDFFSYHIYDGVNVQGNPRDRTGSNSEAIMDLIDSYSHIKFGVAKPIMITEYGKIPEGNMGTLPYSAERSGNMLYALNGQHMTFMDHPDRLLRVIPFILGKALWTYDLTEDPKPGEANPFLIWRKKADGSFAITDLELFYRFWKGVEGGWRVARSSNPDVRVQVLDDGKRLAVILCDLAQEAQQVQLSGLEGIEARKVTLRTLATLGGKPALTERKLDGIPSKLELTPGMGAMLLIEPAKVTKPGSRIHEQRVYATEYLKDIRADKQMVFEFVDTPTGAGSAVVRISPGRELGKAVLPSSVKLNGTPLEIPDNWAGDDQAGRANFFGMIELPVPMEALKATNKVTITYSDSGGKMACVVLQVNLEKAL